MKIYQLVARGQLKHFNGLGKIYSKKVFFDKQKAEEYVSEFAEIATTEIDGQKTDFLVILSEKNLKVNIVELELQDAVPNRNHD